MKKLNLLLFFLLAFCTTFVCACTPTSTTLAKDGDSVIITVNQTVETGTTLIDYMNLINGGEPLKSYTVSDGMITEINGLKARGNVYWMLYTDDDANSNPEWGSVTINGKTYNSASFGAEMMPVKQGCSYLWLAQAF